MPKSSSLSGGFGASPEIRELNRRHYVERLRKHGADVRAIWNSKESQEARFSILWRIGDLQNATILDVGCGFGGFYGYLQERHIYLKGYLGLDCVEETVEVARQRHPQARFDTHDILRLDIKDAFDWVVGSGLFALSIPGWSEYVKCMVQKMFSMAKRGVGVNFLSGLAEHRDEVSYYAEPSEVLRLLSHEVSPIIELLHTYRANDFTVFLYKDYRK